MKSSVRRMLIAFVTMILAIAGAITSVAVATPAQAFTGTPAVFFVPHQDDEVLSMGSAIREHVLAGRQVWVVLLTDGSSSVQCAQQYATRAECTAERDKEFNAGVTSMGANPTIRGDRMVDGTLTAAYVQSVVEEYYNYCPAGVCQYKSASFKGTSEFDANVDHKAVGAGLRAAVANSDKRFYISPAEWAGHTGAMTAQFNLNATLNLYPFGKLSVPAQFNQQTYPNGCYSKYYA